MPLKDQLQQVLDVHSRRHSGSSTHVAALPDECRARILLFYRDLVSGQFDQHGAPPLDARHAREDFWHQIYKSLQQAYGRFKLSDQEAASETQDLSAFLEFCPRDELFDFIELSFKQDATWAVMGDLHWSTDRLNEVIEAIDTILEADQVPYRLTPLYWMEGFQMRTGGQYYLQAQYYRSHVSRYPMVVSAEETMVYEEAIQPALEALDQPDYRVAGSEFTEALSDYRYGRHGDCMTKCSSALESVLKVICHKNTWPYQETDTLETLLITVVDSASLPGFLKEPFKLIGTMRNRLSSSHGGGTIQRQPDKDYSQYTLTATASAIVFLIQKASPQS